MISAPLLNHEVIADDRSLIPTPRSTVRSDRGMHGMRCWRADKMNEWREMKRVYIYIWQCLERRCIVDIYPISFNSISWNLARTYRRIPSHKLLAVEIGSIVVIAAHGRMGQDIVIDIVINAVFLRFVSFLFILASGLVLGFELPLFRFVGGGWMPTWDGMTCRYVEQMYRYSCREPW